MPDDITPQAGGVPAWQILADTLLQREALLCRLGHGRLPRDFAGLYVDDAEADQVLATLPGLAGPPQREADALEARLRPALEAASAHFAASLAGPAYGAPSGNGGEAAFVRLVAGCGLGEFDARVLALLAAVESSPQRMRLVAYIQDNVQLPRLTLDTVERLVPGGARCLAPGGPLRRAELVDLTADGPWAVRMCWPAGRVMWALAGDDSADPALPPGARRVAATGGARTADAISSDAVTGDASTGGAIAAGNVRVGVGVEFDADAVADSGLLLVSGADADSRLDAVRRAWPGRALLVSRPPVTSVEWAAVVREAAVGGRAVVLDVDGPLDSVAADWITKASRLRWALSSPRELALDTLPDRPWSEIRLESGLADAADWARALGVAPDPAFPLSREQLRLVTGAVGADPVRLAAGVRRLAGGHLDDLAVRIRPQRTMADLVLPADQAAQLSELVARYRRRTTVYQEWGYSPLPSTGVVALFAGPSGTGKTLAAEVVAGRLGLDVYKVDLSSVVSKYIGETEKNLERIFTAASAADLVLFFDEADALFGKRSEVGDAHDRYANIEVAYLLQRLESYHGLVIMATNLQRNIDDAFLRRISVSIDFGSPDEPHRRLIWQRAFPTGAPVDALDFDYLARQFKITGGVIRNAALGAAFLAADSGEKITMELVALALKREFQKLGRLRTETEFGRYFDLVNGDGDASPAR